MKSGRLALLRDSVLLDWGLEADLSDGRTITKH